MKYLFLFFSLILSAGVLSAQSNPPAKDNQQWLKSQDTTRQQAALPDPGVLVSPKFDNGFGLHLMPLSFVNRFSRLRLGAQLKHQGISYLLDVEYGVGNDPLIKSDDIKAYQFFGLRPEIRCDVGLYGKGIYVGLEVPFNWTTRNIEGEFHTKEGEYVADSPALLERFRASATAKVGIQTLLGKHVYLDVYTGLGATFREIAYTQLPGEETDIDAFENYTFCGPLSEGKRWLPNLALGTRVGWRF